MMPGASVAVGLATGTSLALPESLPPPLSVQTTDATTTVSTAAKAVHRP